MKVKSKKDKKVKPSALELLARLSGKKSMAPTALDSIEEIEAARVHHEKLLASRPRPPQDVLNSANGSVIMQEESYRTTCGVQYKKRPAMRAGEVDSLKVLFEATHGFRWGETFGWIGRRGNGGRLGLENFEVHPR